MSKREAIFMTVSIYLMLSLVIWCLRMVARGDCVPRYMDYVFPVTKLHCEIK